MEALLGAAFRPPLSRRIQMKARAGTILTFAEITHRKGGGVRLVYLLVVLTIVSEFALAQVFLEAVVQPANCDSSDAAVCLESLFFLE
jgi:hypothetical protein